MCHRKASTSEEVRKEIKMKKEKDIFSEWLDKKETSDWVKLAMKDSSIVKSNGDAKGVNTKTHTEHEINSNLAIVGDAIIKVIQSEVLLDRKVDGLSETRKKYECNWRSLL